jgi:hypothetical protein
VDQDSKGQIRKEEVVFDWLWLGHCTLNSQYIWQACEWFVSRVLMKRWSCYIVVSMLKRRKDWLVGSRRS